jgi:hypothetical protein
MEFLALFLVVVVSITAFLFISYIARELIFAFRPIFFLLNRIQWLLYNPLRFFWRNPHSSFAHRSFNLLFYTGIIPIYWIMAHIVLTPLRLINAIYFNILLGWSVNIYDSLAEVINPKLGGIRHKTGLSYLLAWTFGFPVRLVKMILKNIVTFFEPIIMTGVDTIFPTYTMYHGTEHGYVSADITQNGRWLVGNGNYVGTGIYFGMSKRVADNYSDYNNTTILVRVTLMFNRPIATTAYDVRSRIGLGYGGDEISRRFPKFWSSVEHWRVDGEWFEYCILQPVSKKGSLLKTWRARPIALVQDNRLLRIWGGRAMTPSLMGLFVIVFSWSFIFFLLSHSG